MIKKIVMGIKTDIQWCDSTNNIQMGCEGCELISGPNANKWKCYAGVMTSRYGGKHKGFPKEFLKPELFLHRLQPMLKWPDLTGTKRPDKPWLNDLPRIIFLNDMGDTFTNGLPEDWFAEVLPYLAASPHIYMVLTKWPKRFVEFSEKYTLPVNIWPGTSITSQKTVFRANYLSAIKGGGVKWVSAEPMWSDLKFPPGMLQNIDWIIYGGESGQNATPFNGDWLAGQYRMCGQLGISFFLKQLGTNPFFKGAKLSLKDYHGANPAEWPVDLIPLSANGRQVPFHEYWKNKIKK